MHADAYVFMGAGCPGSPPLQALQVARVHTGSLISCLNLTKTPVCPPRCSQLGVLGCVGHCAPWKVPFSHVHGHPAALGSHHSLLGSSSPSRSPQGLKEAPCWPPRSANFPVISGPGAALCSDNSLSPSDGAHAHPEVTETGVLFTSQEKMAPGSETRLPALQQPSLLLSGAVGDSWYHVPSCLTALRIGLDPPTSQRDWPGTA